MSSLEGLELRRPRTEDLEEIYSIEVLNFSDPFPKKLILIHIMLHSDTSLVASLNGKVIGYAFSAIQVIGGRTALHVLNLAVHPSFKGKGVGRTLMEGLEEIALERDIPLIILEVAVNNPALHFYKKMGFEVVRRVRSYYPDGTDAYLMAKRVSEA